MSPSSLISEFPIGLHCLAFLIVISRVYYGEMLPCHPYSFLAPTGDSHMCEGSCGRKLPTMRLGLFRLSGPIRNHSSLTWSVFYTYILCSSLRIINEKQQLILGSLERSSGFFNAHAVRSVSCAGSNAMVPNSSQYRTSDSSVITSCSDILPWPPSC